MKAVEFCYWLQGYFELVGSADAQPLTGEQVDLIRRHLALAFKHEIDSSYGNAKHQAELDEIHGSPKRPGSDGTVFRC